MDSSAQDSLPVHITISQARINDTLVVVSIKSKPRPGVQLFTKQRSVDDLVYSSVNFDSSLSRKLQGKLLENGQVHSEKDSILNTTVNFVTDSLEWQQIVRLNATDSLVVKGTVDYALKKGNEYPSGGKKFKININPVHTIASTGIGQRSLWWIFLAAFAGGLLALLTPCVYSMIPVTVSFFTKRSRTRKEGIRNAIYYSSSIIIIFTLLGFLVTIIFGPAALNNLATNWIANLLFFALFLLFGFSFLGAFDISLPNKWSNKADTKAGGG
ncbi:MAG: protein-disulfide reductase, partial [Chitinophagaceae bacterium]|nr:protein-disulfide reductase [Chitinophagaceae bacterium]